MMMPVIVKLVVVRLARLAMGVLKIQSITSRFLKTRVLQVKVGRRGGSSDWQTKF